MLSDEQREVPDAIGSNLQESQVSLFLSKVRVEKPNLSSLPDNDILTLCGLYSDGARFTDNKRISGTIPEMLDGAMTFVNRNVKIRTIIDDRGKRADKTGLTVSPRSHLQPPCKHLSVFTEF